LPCLEVVRRYDEDAVLIISCDSGDDFEDQSRMRIANGNCHKVWGCFP